MSAVNVSIDEAHLDAISSVAQALQERGMHVEQVLVGLGIIVGSVADDRRGMLAQVPGVDAISDGQLTYQLPPPAADVQ